MAHSLRQLRSLSDDELVDRYDQTAKSTGVGLSYYEDELNRRAYQRAADASAEEAKSARSLAKANMWLAAAAIIVAILTAGAQIAATLMTAH